MSKYRNMVNRSILLIQTLFPRITFFYRVSTTRFISTFLIMLFTHSAFANHPLEPADTSSPRSTIESFLTITEEVASRYTEYLDDPSTSSQKALEKNISKGERLLDLSQVAPTARYEVAEQSFVLLWEVTARLELPKLNDIPDRSFYSKDDKQETSYWRIPHTDIVIQRVDKGLRKG